MDEDKLTGRDYISRLLLDLQHHPDFDYDIWKVMNLVSNSTTEQLAQIIILGDS